MSRKELVQGVEIDAVAGRRRPLLGALDRGALGPFVEREYELPARVGGDHRRDVAAPAGDIATEPRRRFAPLVEAGSDHESVGREVVLRERRRVLVPGVRLRAARPKAG